MRNAEGDIVQVVYGCDSLDPTYMEGLFFIIFICRLFQIMLFCLGKDYPVDFDRVLQHVKAKNLYRTENPLPEMKSVGQLRKFENLIWTVMLSL